MGPEPASSKTKGSRYRSNEAQPNNRAGEAMERGSQRSESGKSKSEKDVGGTESGRGTKRRQHGGGGDGGGQGGTSGSGSSTHRSSKRWRGDALEALDIPIPADRWDGGTLDTPKENANSSGKSRHESEARSWEGISTKGSNALKLSKEGVDLDKASRKQKVFKGSLASDSRAITVMDLQETDVSIIDSNIRIKNKVSHRRETTLELGEPELEKSGEENAKNAVDSSRSRRRWDRDGHRGDAEITEDASARGNVGGEESQERDKKKQKSTGRDKGKDRDRARDRERDVEARLQNGRRSAEGSRDLAGEVDGRLEISDDISNDFKIQEELRNIELEKELEKRIRRRREESGDRDRWRDNDRERDGKRHSDSRERDDRARDERHSRSRRDRERHSDRYESRQHREGSKVSEGRHRDDRYYESDREYRSHREERYHGVRSKDLEEHARSDRSRDHDHKDRKARDDVTGSEAERRTSREKGPKEDRSERERSHPTTAYMDSPDGARSEHKNKRVRDSDGEGYGAERDHSRQRGRPAESDTMTGNESTHDDRLRRNRENRDAEGRGVESSRESPRDNDGSMRGKSRSNIWRKDSARSETGGDGLSSPRHDSRGSPSSNRMDYTSSPHLDDQRSPRFHSQRSPSHIDRVSSASRGKTGHGDWFESGNSASISSGGPQRRSQGPGLPSTDRRDRLKRNSGLEEEAKGGMSRGSRPTDEGREGSLSPQHRLNERLPLQSKPPLHGQDSFPRGMGSRGMIEARNDRGVWRGAPSGFDGGAMDHHGPDDLSPRDRNDRARRMPMNRPPGSPMVRSQGPQMTSLPAPPLAPLPPPPPFRPGIDNPAVLGPLNVGFDDAGGSRELGRGERKGGPHRRVDHPGGMGPGEGWRGINMGNWNSRNSGPPPGNGFGPFPPQFGHPPGVGGGFPGMGQQFPGPPIFPGGGRPPMDMGFGGGRFLGPGGHMGEGGDGYLGLGRGAGWHGRGDVDDGRGPPLLGPGDGWEGPGPHGDDRLRHGRMEWERGGPIGVRGWERDREREMWEARRDGAPPDFMPHRSQMDPPHQNQPFPSPGSGWGVMPRDGQIHNDLKPRPDRQSFEHQEVKRKPDGGGNPKPKVNKSSGRGAVSTNEGRLSKYATATMQSVLSQLDISAELAGPELYAQYQALLPASASGKQSTPEEQENTISDSEDDDLNLEPDPEGEALIAGPNLLAKLLPPLPDDIFQEALRLYRKPETENRVVKSSRGCFVLPFDPSTIKVPSISLRLDRYNPNKAKDGPHGGVGGLLDPFDVNGLGTQFAEEFVRRNDEALNDMEQGQQGFEFEGTDIEDREGEAMHHEFISSHVEVAEYSDREFEAEMEDALEDDSIKDMHVSGAADEDKESTDNMILYKGSTGPVGSLVHAQEYLAEADNNWQVMDAPINESSLAELEDPVDNVVVEAVQVDNAVVKAYQVDNVVVLADQGDNVVVQAFQVDSVVVEDNQGENVVVQSYQVDSVVVEADQGDISVVEACQMDSVVVEADQRGNAVVQAYQVDSVVVDADQRDYALVQAYQMDSGVVEADEGGNAVVQAYQMDSVVVEADEGGNAVVQAYQMDSVVVEADQGDNAVVQAYQMDSVVLEADQGDNAAVQAYHVDSRVEEVDQVDNVVEEAVEEVDQVDSRIVEVDQVDSVVEEAVEEVDQEDSQIVEVYQVDSVVEEAVEESDQLNSRIEEVDQVDNVIEDAMDEADQVDTQIEKVDQVNTVVGEADRVEHEVGEADRMGKIAANGDLGENVNSSVVSQGAVNYDNVGEPEKKDVVGEGIQILLEETMDPEVIRFSGGSTSELLKPLNVQTSAPDEFPREVQVSKEVIGAAQDIDEENLEAKLNTVVEDENERTVASVETNDQVKDVEEAVGLPEPLNGERSRFDLTQDPASESGAVETIQNRLPEEILPTVIGDDVRTEANGKLKEAVENTTASEQSAIVEPQPEPLTRLRKRRASSRLLAQQEVEAQAAALQEPSDGLVGQGSVGIKKQGTRGTRTSQRRSKRRGSTH